MEGVVLVTFTKDEVERARLVREEKYLLDTQSKVVHAKREGRQERDREIAQNLKKLGLPIGQIVQATGLTEEQISEL
jgi:predicted transposase/invertase (TIGR01784 family)